MKQFSTDIDQVPGLRFLFEAMLFQSSAGKQYQLRQTMGTTEEAIKFQLDKVGKLQSYASNRKWLIAVQSALSDLRDITSTLSTLKAGIVLDEIALFNIKQFAITSQKIKEQVEGLDIVSLDDLAPAIAILDPEQTGLPHFYLYDAYHQEIAENRKLYRRLVQSDPQQAALTSAKIASLELELRADLSSQLQPFTTRLVNNLEAASALDAWLARALLATRFQCTKPKIGHQLTVYHRLQNPLVADHLQKSGKTFQPVDISFYHAPCVITGANMGGKTVLLKTVALCQYLFQYGFFVPAASAVIVVVDEIFTSFNDEQSELQGLSSYAAEMLKITRIIHSARKGNEVLALLDEPARTTSPAEGEAIVNGLVDVLQQYQVRSIITTHFGGLQRDCMRLRVKGLKTSAVSPGTGLGNLQDLMDYTLVEIYPDGSDGYQESHEAFQVAAILGVDTELMQRAETYREQKMFHEQTH